MSGSNFNIMQKLSTQMSYLTQRQATLSQNIANLDTPGYKAKDLKPLDFNDMASAESSRLALRSTSGKHLTGTVSKGAGFSPTEVRSSEEVNPTGNNVELDEEMAKISDTGAQYQIASSLYRKYTAMIRNAVTNR